MRPGLDNRSLLGGLSSGHRLPREDRAGWYHIGGQDVELTLYRRRGYRIVFRTQFKLPLCFELCRLYLRLLCKIWIVN